MDIKKEDPQSLYESSSRAFPETAMHLLPPGMAVAGRRATSLLCRRAILTVAAPYPHPLAGAWFCPVLAWAAESLP